MNGPACTSDNRILNALTAAESGRIFPNLSRVLLKTGTVLCDAGDLARYVYFPTDAVLALICLLRDGTPFQLGMIGNEGESGIGLVMGGETLTALAAVQIGGFAYRMPSAVLHDEIRRCGSVSRLLLRHAQSLLTQTAMLAVCNRHHPLDQQLCRWLLLISIASRRATSKLRRNKSRISSGFAGRALRRRQDVCSSAGRSVTAMGE
jgi:hypothetical protein